MSKKVLVPVHHLKESVKALEYLSNLFARQECTFYLLHTYSYKMTGLDSLQLLHEDEAFFAKPKEASENLILSIKARFASAHLNNRHTYKAVSECSNLISSINRNVSKFQIDIVAVSMQAIQKGLYSFYNSKTTSILEKVRSCPVMVLPSTVVPSKRSKIVFASNFTEPMGQGELVQLINIFGNTNIDFKIVQVGDENFLTDEQIENRDTLKVSLYGISKSPVKEVFVNSLDSLKGYGHEHAKSIICLLDRKPSFLRRLGFAKSPITTLGPISKIPLIALHV